MKEISKEELEFWTGKRFVFQGKEYIIQRRKRREKNKPELYAVDSKNYSYLSSLYPVSQGILKFDDRVKNYWLMYDAKKDNFLIQELGFKAKRRSRKQGINQLKLEGGGIE